MTFTDNRANQHKNQRRKQGREQGKAKPAVTYRPRAYSTTNCRGNNQREDSKKRYFCHRIIGEHRNPAENSGK